MVSIPGGQTDTTSANNQLIEPMEMEATQGEACNLDDPDCLMCGS
jgi:hypothetical protein